MLPAMTWGGRVRRLMGRRKLDHRAVVGGLWDQMGEKQFEYLVQYEPPPLAMDAHMGGFVETPGA